MKWVFVAIALFGPAISWGQAVVGNNGEGVLSGDVIYLRDLYENKNHLSPYVGSKIAPHIAARSWMLSFLKNIPFDQELMLKKISDAEAMQPGFGVFLLEALGIYYFWQSDDTEGVRAPDPLALEKGDTLQFLAVRRYNGIKIFTQRYNLMPAEHRVALILHELIASYVKVIGNNCHRRNHPSPCTQSSSAARILTNKLFTRDAVFSQTELEFLDIEWPKETLASEKIEMNVVVGNQKYSYAVERSRKVFRIEDALIYFSEEVCSSVQTPVSVNIELVHAPFTIRMLGFDPGSFNKAIQAQMEPERCEFSLYFATPYLCRASLKAAQHDIHLSKMCRRWQEPPVIGEPRDRQPR